MAVVAQWRLYYNDMWVARHTVEENATLLIHEVGHLVRDHEARKKAAGITDHRRWNTAGDCEINDDLHAEGLPLPGDPPLPAKYRLESGDTAEVYYKQLPAPPRADGRQAAGESGHAGQDCGSGAHGERRFWELPADDEGDGGTPGVDRLKGRARAARGGPAHRRDLALRWPGLTCVAPVGPRHPRTEGRLPGHDPSCRVQKPCTRVRWAGTTAPTGGRIDGRRATASSSCPASTSRGRGQDF